MKAIVYKVVSKEGGELESSFVGTDLSGRGRPLTVKYAVGKWAKPRFKGTKLFVFLDKEQAISYANGYANGTGALRVFEAEAIGVTQGIWLDFFIDSLDYLKRLFKEKSLVCTPPYPSSRTCLAVKLIKEVA